MNEVTVSLLKAYPSKTLNPQDQLWLSEICYRSGKRFKTLIPESYFISIENDKGKISWEKWTLATKESVDSHKHHKKQVSSALPGGTSVTDPGSGGPLDPPQGNGKAEQELKIPVDKPVDPRMWKAIERYFGKWDIEIRWKEAKGFLHSFHGAWIRRGGANLNDRERQKLSLALTLSEEEKKDIKGVMAKMDQEEIDREREQKERIKKALEDRRKREEYEKSPAYQKYLSDEKKKAKKRAKEARKILKKSLKKPEKPKPVSFTSLPYAEAQALLNKKRLEYAKKLDEIDSKKPKKKSKLDSKVLLWWNDLKAKNLEEACCQYNQFVWKLDKKLTEKQALRLFYKSKQAEVK